MASRIVSVGLAAPYAAIKYAFRTTVKETTSTALGHVAVDTSTAVAGLVFGANHPKPKRASRTTATGIESSFIAESSISAAIAAGWDITKAKSNGRKAVSRFQVPVYVTINGVKYAWAMTKKQLAKLPKSTRDTLGIVEATGLEENLVFGASFPKPPRVRSVATVGKGENATSSVTTTFYDPSKKPSADFAIYNGLITAADFATFL